ncbi:hypothetical protein B566_EDAN002005 [Ephemera danica]|nr:hypothetical protein B566_EDAN002005 [Ephemera danica]
MDECTSLSEIEADAVAKVLEDCITKLEILGHRLPVPAVEAEFPEYQTLEEKYGKDESRVRSEHKSPYSASMLKLQKDRALLEYILKEAVEELRNSRSFNKLHLKVTQFQREHREERKLFTELIELGLTAPGLKKDLASEKQKTRFELQESLKTLAKVQDKVARVRAEGATNKALAVKWETARAGQLDMKLTMDEEGLEKKLEEVARDTDVELRVHAELETFLQATVQDLQEQTEEWKEKYDKDKAEKEEKLAALKQKRDKNMKELKALADLYCRHKKELREYETQREQRQLALEKMRYENEKSILIQAWWRGVMVRRGLGPYKKKKKPVKEKPKKKAF